MNVGVGMKTKETDVSQSCWGYMQMELKATDDFDEQAFHITVELRGLFNWDGSKELIEDLSDEQIKRELSPHAKETVNSLGQKMGYHGLIEPLMNI